jgi:hypothetical protein
MQRQNKKLEEKKKNDEKRKRGADMEKRRLDRYIEIAVDKQMGFKSKMPPDELFEELSDYLWENKMSQEEDAKKYRFKVQIMD